MAAAVGEAMVVADIRSAEAAESAAIQVAAEEPAASRAAVDRASRATGAALPPTGTGQAATVIIIIMAMVAGS
jgi:hypothetical protein